MLTIDDLTLGYERPHRVVNEFSFTVGDGECVAVMGRNGAGKTTLTRGLSGQLRAWGGHVSLNGEDLTRQSVRARVHLGLATVPEGRQLFGRLTVAENLRVAAFGASVKFEPSRLAEIEELFPVLATHREKEAAGLSGGQQQQVALARALMGRPSIIVMDEPSLGLSPNMVSALAGAIERMLANGTAVLLVEQNIGMVQRLCQRAVVLDHGRTIETLRSVDLAEGDRLLSTYLGIGA